MDNNEKNKAYILQSVDNALRVINLLIEKEEMGISEISRELELGKSTAFRLVTTLESRGFVKKNQVNDKYALGLKFVQIGSNVLNRQNMVKIVHPYLQKLTREFNETTHLVVLDGVEAVFMDRVIGTNAIQMHSVVGTRVAPYCTGTGKALLAYLDKDRIEDFLSKISYTRYTNNTITNSDDLKKELERIRQNGFSEDNEEKEVGLICYASPIISYSGDVAGAISISGPSMRMKERRENLVQSIMETAGSISRDLGWFKQNGKV